MNRTEKDEQSTRMRTMLFFLFCFLVISINSLMMPAPPAKQDKANDKAAAADKNAGGKDDGAPQDGDPAKVANVEVAGQNGKNQDANTQAGDAEETAKLRLAVHPQRWVSIGSLDSADGYVMLATLCSTGASIESVELNNSKLIDSEDRSGYLGDLGFASSTEPTGCRIDVVGKGTPAQKAGLQAGDVITRFAGKDVRGASELLRLLADSRPNQKVDVTVQRNKQEQIASCTLGRRPVEVIRSEWQSAPARMHGAGPADPRSLLVGLTQLGNRRLQGAEAELADAALRNVDWQVVEQNTGEASCEFQYEFPGELRIRKRYELVKAKDAASITDRSYHINVTIALENLSQETLPVAYRLDGPNGLPTEGWWYAQKVSPYFFRAAGMRDLWLKFTSGQPTLFLLSEVLASETTRANNPESEGVKQWTGNSPLEFIGVDAQYFSAILAPQPKDPGEIWFSGALPMLVGNRPKETIRDKLANISFRLEGRRFDLAAKETIEHRFELFLGPKKPELLRQYKQASGDLNQIMYYGWFGFVSRPMLALLHFFHAILGNHALAIVMLTATVKLCMLPVTRNQVRMMHKMQMLQPEMKAIADKHPQDLMARNAEQQALFKKHGVNQFGGCLPALVQLPIFVGLYKALMVDIDLRQSPLISQAVNWCTNLAAPDQLFYWKHLLFDSLANETGWLGPFFNVMPLVTMGVFLWQNRMMMPPAVDEQQKMQQNMMIYMTVFMGVMFFKVASGLCIYIIVSSLWSLGERKWLTRAAAMESEANKNANAPPRAGWATLLQGKEPVAETPAERKKRRQQTRKK